MRNRSCQTPGGGELLGFAQRILRVTALRCIDNDCSDPAYGIRAGTNRVEIYQPAALASGIRIEFAKNLKILDRDPLFKYRIDGALQRNCGSLRKKFENCAAEITAYRAMVHAR